MKIRHIIAAFFVLIAACVSIGRSSSAGSPHVAVPPDEDKQLRIRDLTVDDIRSGQNWKITFPEELLQAGKTLNLEDVHISRKDSFSKNDTVAYSAVSVDEEGKVLPIVLIKNLSKVGHDGVCCEFRTGKWSQAASFSGSNTFLRNQFFANPLQEDPSFDSSGDGKGGSREMNRAGFQKWSEQLSAPQNSQTAASPEDESSTSFDIRLFDGSCTGEINYTE